MTYAIDDKDRLILRALQEDGRLSNQDLAQKVNLSPSPTLRRVRALEEAGVIQGYTALVDQKAYGLPITAFIRIRLDRHSRERILLFESEIAAIPEIMDVWLTTGGADYMLRSVVPSLDAYEDLIRHKLHTIAGIASIDSSFAFGTVKQSRLFPC